jgi:hypothetical protein
MKFLLTIYGEESGWGDASPEEIGQVMAAYEAFGRAAAEAGVLVGGEGLQPTSTATTVRVRDNETLTTDGPFAVLDCSDLDDAIGWAARIPGAQNGSVEVRPVMNYESAEHVDEARERAQR